MVELETEENSSIEFKSGKSLNAENLKIRAVKDEMGKDASAMANGIGGVIIYGIGEENIRREGFKDRKKAIGFASVTNPNATKDMLTEIFRDNMRPPLPYLEVTEINSPEGYEPEFRCFAVEIPSSCLAHQAKDNKFFIRRAATTDEMEQHEIVAVMNRQTWPELSVEVGMGPSDRALFEDESLGYSDHSLAVRVVNTGKTLCQFLCIEVVLPVLWDGKLLRIEWLEAVETDHGQGLSCTFDTHKLGPTPPGMARSWYLRFALLGLRELHTAEGVSPLRDLMRLRVFADTMPMEEKWVVPRDVWRTQPTLKRVL